MFICLGYVRVFPNVRLWQRVLVCSCFFLLGLSCVQIQAFHDLTLQAALQAESFKLGWGSICLVGEVWYLFWLCVDCENYFSYVVTVLGIFQVWMYEYFGVGPEIQDKVIGIFPRFLRWLPKHRLSPSSRCSLELWRLVIDNLTIDVSSFFLLLFKSLAFGYDSVSSLSEFLFCDFSDELKSLGWM